MQKAQQKKKAKNAATGTTHRQLEIRWLSSMRLRSPFKAFSYVNQQLLGLFGILNISNLCYVVSVNRFWVWKSLTSSYCGRDAVYSCAVCGKPVGVEHVKFRTLCTSCTKERRLKYTVAHVVSEKERPKIGEVVRRFWGEEEQLTFDRKFTVKDLPALVAEANGDVIGFLAFAELADAVIIVALGILPEFQGSGVGKGLVEKLEDKARSMSKRRLLVSTSNDDLPALAFYQSFGFQIYEVKPNVIAEKHGEVLKGIGGLLIRDELRLQKNL